MRESVVQDCILGNKPERHVAWQTLGTFAVDMIVGANFVMSFARVLAVFGYERQARKWSNTLLFLVVLWATALGVMNHFGLVDIVWFEDGEYHDRFVFPFNFIRLPLIFTEVGLTAFFYTLGALCIRKMFQLYNKKTLRREIKLFVLSLLIFFTEIEFIYATFWMGDYFNVEAEFSANLDYTTRPIATGLTPTNKPMGIRLRGPKVLLTKKNFVIEKKIKKRGRPSKLICDEKKKLIVKEGIIHLGGHLKKLRMKDEHMSPVKEEEIETSDSVRELSVKVEKPLNCMAGEYVIVKYDYMANEEQELTVRKDDRLLLVDDSRNWWKVKNEHNKVGFVPSNYVRKETILERAKGNVKAAFNNGRQRSNEFNAEEASFSSAPEIRPIFSTNQNNCATNNFSNSLRLNGMTNRAVVKFPYEPQLDDELRLNKGDTINVVDKSSDGWWKGEYNGVSGWFPSNYVDEIADIKSSNNAGSASVENVRPSNGNNAANYNPPQPAIPSPNVKRESMETVVALYSFEATTIEELSFKKGEKLDVIDHPAHDPDWWMARNAKGSVGLIPKNYIQIVDEDNGVYDREPWYFGRIGRDDAETLLMAGMEGEFLVRDSESNPGDLSISMRGQERNKHFKVQTLDGQLLIGSRSFPDMYTLIEHYKTHPIFSNGNEKLYLTRPLRKN